MQQFNVPQFIDVEDKVLGPITVRQFVIILVCGLLSAAAYKLADFALFLTLTIFIFGIGGIIAFLKINGRPFHYFILNVIQTFKKPKLRIWNNQLSKTSEELKEDPEIEIEKITKVEKKPLYPKSKLAEVSLIVDTGGSYQGGDNTIK
ncbi:MAG: PrgI family protein [Patescibacteria group bacterium]